MRTLVLIPVVLVCACGGQWLPDVPPPPARQSAAVPVEVVFRSSKAQPFAIWSSTAEHTAWVAEGQLHWLSATGRGVLPLPPGPIWAVDAANDQGWAQTGQQELLELSPGGSRSLPLPPRRMVGKAELHAFDRDVLIVSIARQPATASEPGQATSLCVWRSEAWTCVDAPGELRALSVDGRDPRSAMDCLLHAFEGNERLDHRLEVATGRLTRLTSPSAARPLENGATVTREGRLPPIVSSTTTEVRVGCFDPDGKVLPLCTQWGPVSEVVFSEADGEAVREVAHVRVDVTLSPLRRHGQSLVSFTLDDGVVITLP